MFFCRQSRIETLRERPPDVWFRLDEPTGREKNERLDTLRIIRCGAPRQSIAESMPHQVKPFDCGEFLSCDELGRQIVQRRFAVESRRWFDQMGNEPRTCQIVGQKRKIRCGPTQRRHQENVAHTCHELNSSEPT